MYLRTLHLYVDLIPLVIKKWPFHPDTGHNFALPGHYLKTLVEVDVLEDEVLILLHIT